MSTEENTGAAMLPSQGEPLESAPLKPPVSSCGVGWGLWEPGAGAALGPRKNHGPRTEPAELLSLREQRWRPRRHGSSSFGSRQTPELGSPTDGKGFPGASDSKESACSAEATGDAGSILGREDPRKRKWQLTPVFLPGASHGQRSLAGYGPWGRRVRHN